jgi:hypothetical protein
LLIETMTLRDQRSKANDKVLRPDRRLRRVRTRRLCDSEPSSAYRRLIGPAQPELKITPMTKFYALIAACAVFAPMAMATLSQAAQIVA